MTALDDWWAIEADHTLTESQKLSLLNTIRQVAFENIELPFYVGSLEIMRIEVVGARIDVSGIGVFSWPLRIHNGPVGVPHPDGNVVKADGSTWYSDPIEVIAQCIRSAV